VRTIGINTILVKNNLKYKHSGATGKLVSVVSINDITVYYVHVYHKTTSSILETGGRVNKAARDWLDALTAPDPGEQVPSQDDHPWNPQTRTTTKTVLRETMQALVRIQAHMLARIVVETRAADIAVELEP